uniref:K+ potassium transporter integral membrane domain-containing protein n=1 Tax=Manihot esculenta TaxID=3983 RepID=A0A2C9UMA2_MANES
MAEENFGTGSSVGGGSEINGRLASMDSVESRWVFQDDDDSVMDDDDEDEEDDGALHRTAMDSEDDDDNAEQRLIRTGPRIDSFDVEALEIPGAQRNDYEDFSVGRKIIIAFQTLGIVFGDVGTSPLYAFDVMFTKAPINGKEDVLGALSLVLYTLILIPLIKYVLVVLWANDDGEGGTFALYSLICRHAKVSLLPNQLPSDARISSFRLKVPSPELERSLKIKERLETSQTLKKLLLILVLAVMSAVGGLKVGVAAIEQVHPWSSLKEASCTQMLNNLSFLTASNNDRPKKSREATDATRTTLCTSHTTPKPDSLKQAPHRTCKAKQNYTKLQQNSFS